MHGLVVVAGFLVACGWAVDAAACALDPCARPQATVSGDIPENLPGLVYSKPGSLVSVTPSLKRLDTGAEVGVQSLLRDEAPGMQSTMVLVQPDQPFVAGVGYELTFTDKAGRCDDVVFTYQVGAAQTLPEALGALSVSSTGLGPVQVASDTACSESIDAAQAVVEIALAADVVPWLDFLDVMTFVDGVAYAPWKSEVEPPAPGASAEGRGRQRLYAGCGENLGRGLEEGAHLVKMVATLPGAADFKLESEEIEVLLSCSAPMLPESPAAESETTAPEAGGCSVGGAQRQGAGGMLGLLLGSIFLWRSRRRARLRAG